MSEQITDTIEPVTQPVSGLSFRGLIQVFTSPTSFFRSLKDHPKILVPYLVLGIMVLVFFILSSDILVKMQLANPKVQESFQSQPIPMETRILVLKYSTMFFGTIAFLLTPIVGALFAIFFGNFIFAGKARFKQLLSVMIYGEIVFAVGMLLTLPMILAKESMLVSYSLAVLVSQLGPENVFYVILSKISVFHIWEYVVVGLGLSAIYNLTPGKGFRLSMLSIGLISILHIVIAAITSLFK